MGNHFFLLTPDIGRRKGAGLNKGDGAGQVETGSFLGIHFSVVDAVVAAAGFAAVRVPVAEDLVVAGPLDLVGDVFAVAPVSI